MIELRKLVILKKSLLAFDIDHTLSLSKQPISEEVANLLVQLLEWFDICIISGRNFEQFRARVIDRLPITDTNILRRLHCLPAQGTQYYHFYNEWELLYAYYLSDDDVARIFEVVETVARELGFWRESNPDTDDVVLENRLSQVTFAAVDTGACVTDKLAWDPDCSKRKQMVARMEKLAPKFEFKIGGSTSIDITVKGRDKEFGMSQLLKRLDLSKDEVLYFGDMTQPGGNDYPVVQMGIDVITVREYHDTIFAMKALCNVLS